MLCALSVTLTNQPRGNTRAKEIHRHEDADQQRCQPAERGLADAPRPRQSLRPQVQPHRQDRQRRHEIVLGRVRRHQQHRQDGQAELDRPARDRVATPSAPGDEQQIPHQRRRERVRQHVEHGKEARVQDVGRRIALQAEPSPNLNNRPRIELFSKWVDQRAMVSPPPESMASG